MQIPQFARSAQAGNREPSRESRGNDSQHTIEHMKQNTSKSDKHGPKGRALAGTRVGASGFPGGRQGFGEEGLTDDDLPNSGHLRLLAVLLAAPEEGSLALVEELAQAHDWLRAPAAELLRMPLGEWQAEHTRLFVSGYPKTACPPFESAYRKGDSGGLAAEQLSAFYLSLGLATDGVSSDYLGTILECAAYLLDTPRTADDDSWSSFWQEHFVGWVPRFAQDLLTESRLMLYRQFAEELLDCVPDDRH